MDHADKFCKKLPKLYLWQLLWFLPIANFRDTYCMKIQKSYTKFPSWINMTAVMTNILQQTYTLRSCVKIQCGKIRDWLGYQLHLSKGISSEIASGITRPLSSRSLFLLGSLFLFLFSLFLLQLLLFSVHLRHEKIDNKFRIFPNNVAYIK